MSKKVTKQRSTLIKIFSKMILTALLLVSTLTFAQVPDFDDDVDDEIQAVPLNSKIFLMTSLSIAFGIYIVNRNAKIKINQK